MKIFPVEKIRELDAYTIAHEPVTSVDLMERAARQCFNWIMAKMPGGKAFLVFCGTGNNGGDGLVIARLLAEKRREVRVHIFRSSKEAGPDFQVNYDRLRKNPKIKIVEHAEGEVPADLPAGAIVIDALFGSGLNKPLEAWYARIIETMNAMDAFRKIAIDMPSGLFGEDNLKNTGVVFRADITLSFQFPKLAFMFAENEAYTGEWQVLPIGLHPKFIEENDAIAFMVGKEDVAPLVQRRKRFAHKGKFGHALLIAGSKGKMGAAILSSKACLRAGAGLVTAHIPACGYNAMQTAVAEVMVSTDEEENYLGNIPDISSYTAIGVGPGLGKEDQTQKMLKLLIQEANLPMLLDADALNILGENKTWLAFLRPGCVLTPHPKEFDRMAGESTCGYERWKKQIEFSRRFNVYVVLKGAYTSISFPDGRCYFNSSGCPGMATAGSGDVLTGIILGLLAQGYKAGDACLLGVYIHGLAGEVAAGRKSITGMIAGDITEALGKAWMYFGA
jgi:NAD(P)H-hydrate epimerase